MTLKVTQGHLNCLYSRGVHGDGDGGFPAGMGVNVAGIPRGWIWQLRDSHVDGYFLAGTPRKWSTNSAVKNFGVRTVFRQTILFAWMA